MTIYTNPYLPTGGIYTIPGLGTPALNDVLKGDGSGGWVIGPVPIPPGTQNLCVQLSHDAGVPPGGTRYLRVGDNSITSVAGFRLTTNGFLQGLSIQVQTPSANTYDLEILRDSPGRLGAPVVIATLTLPPGAIDAENRTYAVPVTTADELGARVVLTAGAGLGLGQIDVLTEWLV